MSRIAQKQERFLYTGGQICIINKAEKSSLFSYYKECSSSLSSVSTNKVLSIHEICIPHKLLDHMYFPTLKHTVNMFLAHWKLLVMASFYQRIRLNVQAFSHHDKEALSWIENRYEYQYSSSRKEAIPIQWPKTGRIRHVAMTNATSAVEDELDQVLIVLSFFFSLIV